MKASRTEPYTGRELRWIADAYEQAQRVRIQTGERIRAVLQGRDETWPAPVEEPLNADAELVRIRKGESEGPVPLLARTYRRYWQEEQELSREMKECLASHPAWPWLSEVKGIGATLACKLIARLDATKADTPSSFWAYCGLATVPGIEYRCQVCGLRSAFPLHYRVSGSHARLGSKRPCTGVLEPARGPEQGVRVAQPKPGKGERAAYDRYAKKVCYLIATSFLKSGGPYADFYRRERAKLERERPGWAEGRKHLTALRKTEKLFLAHLWLVWREALGLPVTQPYAQAQQGHTSILTPREMTNAEDAPLGPSASPDTAGTPRSALPPRHWADKPGPPPLRPLPDIEAGEPAPGTPSPRGWREAGAHVG